MFRLATQADFSKILAIYNQVIACRTVTADLQPATESSRQEWFEFHLNHDKYPIWVCEQNGEVLGWCSLSPFHSRAAYDGTAEISFYLDTHAQGKGLGKACVEFVQSKMPEHGLHSLVALVFGNNAPSLGLLEKCGFSEWGSLPKVADMQSHWEDLVILGYKHSQS